MSNLSSAASPLFPKNTDTGLGRLIGPRPDPEIVQYLEVTRNVPQRMLPSYRSIAPQRTDAEEHIRQLTANEIGAQHGIPRLAAEILAGRGYSAGSTLQDYLDKPTAPLPDPGLIKGVNLATLLLCDAIKEKKLVAFIGDFDVDGITAVSQAVHTWRNYGAPYLTYIPCRLTEGYGLSAAAVDFAHAKGAKIIVCLDIGSTNHETIARAQRLGMRVVVVDHHLGDDLDSLGADVLINPHQRGCGFESGNLCASGLTHFLMRSIMLGIGTDWSAELLPLAMFGTIADVPPLQGSNRTIAALGLKACRDTKLIGVKALLESFGKDGVREAADVAYGAGPVINALGRIRRRGGSTALRLLTTENPVRATQLATLFHRVNSKRKTIEGETLERAIQQIEKHRSLPKVIVLKDKHFHPGVLGLDCSRLVERYRRPTLLLQEREDGTLRGSGRSVEGLNLKEQLDICKQDLTHYGGHTAAVGLSLLDENFDQFDWHINFRTELPEDEGVKADKVLSLRTYARQQNQIVSDTKALGPTGMGNPPVSFFARKVKLVSAYLIGKRHSLVVLKEGKKAGTFVEAYFWHTPDHPAIVDPKGSVTIGRNGMLRVPVRRDALLDVVYRPMRFQGRDFTTSRASAKIELVAVRAHKS